MANLIGISGRIGSGKDTVGKMIQMHMANHNAPICNIHPIILEELDTKNFEMDLMHLSQFEIVKFAGKLKQVASLITGIPVEKFEDQEFKKTVLGEEWSTYKFKAGNGEYYHFGSAADLPKYDRYGYDIVSMTVREFLQKLGTDAVRNHLHTNTWVNATFSEFTEDSNWIITDMRFPNELQAVKDRGGITIRVNRDSLNNTARLHPSETALDKATFDIEISNNGTLEDLSKAVYEILQFHNLLPLQ